jgi:hypothetical protein
MYSPSEMRKQNFGYEFLTRGMIDGLAHLTGLTVWRSATDCYDSPSTRFSQLAYECKCNSKNILKISWNIATHRCRATDGDFCRWKQIIGTMVPLCWQFIQRIQMQFIELLGVSWSTGHLNSVRAWERDNQTGAHRNYWQKSLVPFESFHPLRSRLFLHWPQSSLF